MKHVLGMAAALVLAGPLAAVSQAQSADARIAEAVEILPADLRAGATVVTYDPATGERKVLRQGTNFLECQPRMDDGFTRCYNKSMAPRRDMEAKLKAEKKSDKEVQEAIAAAVKSGALKPSSAGNDGLPRLRQARSDQEPVGDLAAQRDARIGRRLHRQPARCRARRQGAAVDDAARDARRARHDPDQPGGEEHDRHRRGRRSDHAGDAAAAGRPARGGDGLHLRQGDRRAEGAARGHQPDRVHAAQPGRWVHVVLQQGGAPRRDFQAKLRAEGKSEKEIQEATAAATKDGTLKPTPFGTMSYRLYGKKDRIQLLWVLSVPGATPETIGVSEGSQRDEALKGQGVPWLMLPGTPGAHIMIPINK